MKKGVRNGLAFFGLVLAVLVFSLQLVSAVYSLREISEKTIDAFVDGFEPVLAVIFGGTSWSGLFLFEKLLVFIVFVAVVYLALGQIPVFEENSKVRWVVSVIVPLIGVRFLDYDWMMVILLQYKLLAIVITAFLPFIIFFFFIHRTAGEHDVIRKIGWIFFIVVYFGLWSTSSLQLADIYFWTMLASLLFLLFDGTIHRYYLRQEMREANSANKWEHITKLRRDIQEINDSIRLGHVPDRIGRKMIRKKEKQIKWILKQKPI